MGLDQYLKAKKYVSGWDHGTADERVDYNKLTDLMGAPTFRCEGCPSGYIELNVAYWRKANQIHRWFVENVQGGKDECQDSYVSREQLEELVSLCKEVLDSVETVEGEVGQGTSYYPDGRVVKHTKPGEVVAQQGIAAAKLPTASGFFFGSTDYDEYYLQDLKDTVTQLRAVLDNPAFENCEFEYHANW